MRRAVRIRLRHPPTSLHIQRFSAKFAENRRISGRFASLAAPEIACFEPFHGEFDVLSLMRISLVPRENTAEIYRATLVPSKNSESGEKSRVLRFTAMMSPAWVVPQDLPASKARSENLWRIEPTCLFSKPGLRRGGRPSEPVHHASQAMRGRLDLRRNSGRIKF